MTIDELKAISEQCQTDAEFLAHSGVVQAYWLAMRKDTFAHDVDILLREGATEYTYLNQVWGCTKCRAVCCGMDHDESVDICDWGEQACSVPDPIPGSLPDACEQLRVKVAEKWHTSSGIRTIPLCDVSTTPRDRFLIFAAALLEGQR